MAVGAYYAGQQLRRHVTRSGGGFKPQPVAVEGLVPRLGVVICRAISMIDMPGLRGVIGQSSGPVTAHLCCRWTSGTSARRTSTPGAGAEAGSG